MQRGSRPLSGTPLGSPDKSALDDAPAVWATAAIRRYFDVTTNRAFRSPSVGLSLHLERFILIYQLSVARPIPLREDYLIVAVFLQRRGEREARRMVAKKSLHII
jgi:hypothetical protein